MMIRVLIADDHKLFRQGLKCLLDSDEKIKVVAEAESGRQAVDLCWRLKPDVAVLDIAMPDMNGIVATGLILKMCEKTRVLILSMYLNEAYVIEALRKGASGYILKDCAVEELLNAIKEVNRGETFLSAKALGVAVKELL